MESQIQLPEFVWAKMNIAWAGLFTALGFINLYVAYNYSQDTWVNFKLFGITGILFAFIILQTMFISQYLPKEDNKEDHQ